MLNIGTWIFEQPMNLVQIPHSIKYMKKFYEKVNFKSKHMNFEKLEQENENPRKQVYLLIGLHGWLAVENRS